MKEFLYVRCEVTAPNPEIASLLKSIHDQAKGADTADVVPEMGPERMRFKHVRLMAFDTNKAYDLGHELLPEVDSDVVCINDYVVEI